MLLTHRQRWRSAIETDHLKVVHSTRVCVALLFLGQFRSEGFTFVGKSNKPPKAYGASKEVVLANKRV